MVFLSGTKMKLLLRIINLLYSNELFFQIKEEEKYIEMVVKEFNKIQILMKQETKHETEHETENIEFQKDDRVEDDDEFITVCCEDDVV